MQMPIVEAAGEIASALANNLPIVLVAGQSLDSQSHSQDRVLSQALNRLSLPAGSSWRDLLKRGINAEDVSWLSERFERAVPSESFAAVADFPWSAVFTSSPDPKFAKLFATRGRQPEAVLSSGTFARVSRSRSRPPVYYLFGKMDETHPDWTVPKRQAEFIRRSQVHTTELVNRISDTATTGGLVVLAGIEPGRDWLDVEAVLASMEASAGPRILYFGDRLVDSAMAAELRDAERLLEVNATLSSLMLDLQGVSGSEYGRLSSPDDPGTVSTAAGALNITPGMRLRVEASATIVDDEWTVPGAQLSSVEAEEYFRRFHGDLGGFRGLVDGVSRGFAIRRDFEVRLLESIDENIERLSQIDATLIVFGQSGTGKSISMARLAYEIRRDRKLPVLFASGRLPNYADIEGFCEEAERVGAVATVLLCDANLPAHRYRDFSSGLRSRGRRVLTVGTSYESEAYDAKDSLSYVHAPASLSPSEVGALSELVQQPWLSSKMSAVAPDSTFLATLYRQLSVGREKLTAGLSSEARHWERVLRERSRKTPKAKVLSSLALQLLDLGLASQTETIFEPSPEGESLGTDAAAKLLDYVMVPGRLNCPVPLNLVMRVLRSQDAILDIGQIAYLFADLDIFRWRTSGAEGADLLIAPRLQIEAELICKRRVADAGREIAILVDLIRATRAGGVDSDAERSFLFDLLQKLDREGPRKDAYRSGYLQFADALRNLRLHAGVMDASLMLRESVFRRQAVWSLDWADLGDSKLDERLPILEAARATVEEAITLIDSGDVHASKRTRLNLTAERASIYGYLAVQRFKQSDFDGSWSDYLAARIASAKAIALSDGYHPIDIALWTSSDMLKSDHLSLEQRSEIVAELYSTLDLVDSDALNESQRERFLERRHKAATLIGDSALTAETISALEKISPATATFLLARTRAEPFLRAAGEPDPADSKKAEDVATFLIERIGRDELEDVRCHRLLLQCQWLACTGERLLHGEKGKTPATERDARQLLGTVRRLNELLGTSARNQERYLEAVLAWIARDYTDAAEIWRELSKDSEYEDRSRIIRRLIMSGPDGEPAKFAGRIESASSSGAWRVRIEGLDVAVPLLAHEFAGEQLALGREIRKFGVAFNYVGPIADSLTRGHKRR